MSRKNKPKIRNRYACSPIMRKGGVHEKSVGAKRAAEKNKLRNTVRQTSNSRDET